ncbi:hypothetical protein ACIQW7_24420 [Peribacillus simplex]|uniref:hypothetical protein n=1 Tax=Peribacillus simplex TaxID=1478 RepID=UPI0038153DB6
MAQFKHIWPEIKTYLDTKLGENLACSAFQDEAEAFRRLSEDLNHLTMAWYQWATNINQLLEVQTNNKIELYYDIGEFTVQPNDEKSVLCITVKSIQGAFALPWFKIRGYETECIRPGEYKFYQCLDEEKSISKPCCYKIYLAYKDRNKMQHELYP